VIKTVPAPGADGYIFDAPTHHFFILSHGAPNLLVVDSKDGSIVGKVEAIGPKRHQGARELVGVEVEDAHSIPTGDINPAVDAVRRNIVNPPGGGNLRGGKNLVGLGREVVGRSDLGKTQKRRQAKGGRK
jgi:hypothetical protein